MGRVKKSIIASMFCLVFVLLICSFVVAQTGFVFNENCAPQGASLFLANAEKNAHASSNMADAATYPYSVCYSSLPQYSESQILRQTVGDGRQCVFSNEIVSLSSVSNAHVEGPLANTYDYPVCFNYLECRVSQIDTKTADEQIVAKLSGDTDAHVSIASDSGPFNRFLICKEPICDATAGRSSVFPLISGFESGEDTLSPTVSGGAVAQISTLQKYTGTSSLKLSYPISAQLSDESVALTLGNKNNFAGYDYLEFYLYVEKSLGIYVVISTTQGDTKILINDAVAPQGLAKNKWNLIQIPISQIAGISNVQKISFVAQPNSVVNFLSGSTYNYYVDSIQLSSKSLTTNFAKQYCLQNSGTNLFSWSTQLSGVNSTWLNRAAPLSVLTPSGRVCGEQPGETYSDGAVGCFNSNAVVNGSPIEVILTDSGKSLCVGVTCSVLAPPILVGTQISSELFETNNPTHSLESYSFKSRSVDVISNDEFVDENVLRYDLERAHIVYGVKRTVESDNTAGSLIGTEQFYSCGNVEAEFSSVVTALLPDEQTEGSSCTSVGAYTCVDSSDASSNYFVSLPSGTANGNKCVDGKWEKLPTKQNYKGSEEGYCAQESQCFLTNFPTENKPGCIDSTQYYQNYYCDGGDWTSRTAILASQIIKFAGDNENLKKGTLYCDSYTRTLNDINYQNIKLIFEGTYGSEERTCAPEDSLNLMPDELNEFNCVNSFCVFSPEDKTQKPIFGTSINRPFANISGLGTIFAESCKDVENSAEFEKCADSNYYYNSQLQLILYNQNSVQSGFIAGAFNVLKKYIFTPLMNIFTDTPSLAEQFTLANESKLYSRFYYALTDNVSISAFYELRQNRATLSSQQHYIFKILTKEVKPFDLCTNLVTPYNSAKKLTGQQEIYCSHPLVSVNSEGNWKNQTLIVGDSGANGLWPTLTANLRPS